MTCMKGRQQFGLIWLYRDQNQQLQTPLWSWRCGESRRDKLQVWENSFLQKQKGKIQQSRNSCEIVCLEGRYSDLMQPLKSMPLCTNMSKHWAVHTNTGRCCASHSHRPSSIWFQLPKRRKGEQQLLLPLVLRGWRLCVFVCWFGGARTNGSIIKAGKEWAKATQLFHYNLMMQKLCSRWVLIRLTHRCKCNNRPLRQFSNEQTGVTNRRSLRGISRTKATNTWTRLWLFDFANTKNSDLPRCLRRVTSRTRDSPNLKGATHRSETQEVKKRWTTPKTRHLTFWPYLTARVHGGRLYLMRWKEKNPLNFLFQLSKEKNLPWRKSCLDKINLKKV